MSLEYLVRLQDRRVFDPTLPFEELGDLHVPFDEMHRSATVERRLDAAVRRGERVALIGTTGTGKSSTAAYVVRPGDQDIAGFRIGVTIEEPEILANPGRFAQHVVRRIARDAGEVSGDERADLQIAVADAREVRPGRSRRGAATINAKVLQLSGELGSVSASITQQTSSHELVQALDHALDLVRSTGASPVLVIDDSDTWIEVADESVHARRDQFFRSILRMLAERHCSLIVAVDERYLGLDEYQNARDGLLPIEIHLPRVVSSTGLRLLLGRRVGQIDGARLDDTFTHDAIAELFTAYVSKPMSLRALMRCTSSAVYHAVAAGADLVGRQAVGASLREYLAERGG
jgi:hypothetical protein